MLVLVQFGSWVGIDCHYNMTLEVCMVEDV